MINEPSVMPIDFALFKDNQHFRTACTFCACVVFLMGGDSDPPPKYSRAAQLVFILHEHRLSGRGTCSFLLHSLPLVPPTYLAAPWLGLVTSQIKVSGTSVRFYWGELGLFHERQP